MVDPKFVSVKTKARGRLRGLADVNEETREAFGYDLVDKVIERSPLAKVETAMLFTYMHRRFGLGNVVGDDYKDLGAGWLISTPREDVLLHVTPSFSGPGFSFTPLVVADEQDKGWRDTIRGDLLASMMAAYERTLLDLLRPVCQRDQDFNVLGEIDDEENCVPDWAEADDDNYDDLPHYHKTCGTPMPDGLFGSAEWHRLLGLLQVKGGGDVVNGVRHMADEAEKEAISAVRAASEELLPIVAAGVQMARDESSERILSSLGLSEAGTERMHEFTRFAYGHSLTAPLTPWLRSVTPEQIRSSAELVAAFGFGTGQLRKAVESVTRAQLYESEWERFVSLSGGEFEFDHIPDDDYPGNGTVEGFRRNVAAAGLDRISKWADGLAATELGMAALWTVVSQLWNQKKAIEKEANDLPARKPVG